MLWVRTYITSVAALKSPLHAILDNLLSTKGRPNGAIRELGGLHDASGGGIISLHSMSCTHPQRHTRARAHSSAPKDLPEHLQNDVEYQSKCPQHSEDFDKLPPILCLHLRLNMALDSRTVSREAASGNVLLEELVLFSPDLTEPQVKLLCVAKRYVCNGEASPVEVDRFRWPPLEICACKAEIILAILATATLSDAE